MQERGFDSDPLANLVVGLAFCQLWYSGIPKELQLTELDSSGTYMQAEILANGVHMPVDYSKENGALEAGRESSPIHCDSNTSVANDKELFVDDCNQQKESMDIDENIKKETSDTSLQPPEFDMESPEASGNSNYYSLDYSGDLPHASIFYTQGKCENPLSGVRTSLIFLLYASTAQRCITLKLQHLL